jgi:hypothetical protein
LSRRTLSELRVDNVPAGVRLNDGRRIDEQRFTGEVALRQLNGDRDENSNRFFERTGSSLGSQLF